MLMKVELNNRNLLIIAVSVGLGLGVTTQPALFQFLPAEAQTILSNGMVVGSFVAVILNILLNNTSLQHKVEE